MMIYWNGAMWRDAQTNEPVLVKEGMIINDDMCNADWETKLPSQFIVEVYDEEYIVTNKNYSAGVKISGFQDRRQQRKQNKPQLKKMKVK